MSEGPTLPYEWRTTVCGLLSSKAILDRYGWRRVRVDKVLDDYLLVDLRCGHRDLIEVPPWLGLSDADAFSALLGLIDADGRPCFCVPYDAVAHEERLCRERSYEVKPDLTIFTLYAVWAAEYVRAVAAGETPQRSWSSANRVVDELRRAR